MAEKRVIDPWGSVLVEDYNKIINQFGLEAFDSNMFPNPNKVMRRGTVFAGRDFKVIADCIKNKKPFYALTGIVPSADRIHFGNSIGVSNLRYFQEHGAKTYMLVADLEASAARGVSLEESRRRALEFHIPAYIALGLDPKKTVFYFQSENIDVMRLSYDFSKHVTLNEFKAVYGNADPSRIASSLAQMGDMLYPQLEEKMPGIIPVGVDQDPHIRLTRDVIARTKEKYGFAPLASMYHKFTPSLDGGLKMSKSKPSSMVELPEDESLLRKKMKATKTGGRETIEEQKRIGGEPEKCIVFELYKQHLIEDDKDLDSVYQRCKAGKLLCKEDKQSCSDLIVNFMQDFNKKVEQARKIVPKLKFVRF